MRKRIAVDDDLDDPRPLKFRNNKGYPDFVLSSVTNYCAETSQNIAFRYLYPKADIQASENSFEICSSKLKYKDV